MNEDEKVILFEDKETRIEIAKWFDDFIKKILPPELLVLTQKEFENFISKCILSLFEKYKDKWNIFKPKIQGSSSVPYIEYMKPLALVEDYKDFEFGFNALSLVNIDDLDFEEIYDSVILSLYEHYEEENIKFQHIKFENEKINGALIICEEKVIKICFYVFHQNEIDL